VEAQVMLAKISGLESQIEKAKHDKARLSGRVEELVKRLEVEFGVKTVEEAEALLTKMQEDIKDGAARLDNMFTRMKEKHGWEV